MPLQVRHETNPQVPTHAMLLPPKLIFYFRYPVADYVSIPEIPTCGFHHKTRHPDSFSDPNWTFIAECVKVGSGGQSRLTHGDF